MAGGMQAGAAAVEKRTEGPEEVKYRITIRSTNATTGIYPKKIKTII